MNRQLQFQVGSHCIRVFLEAGFLVEGSPSAALHRHCYPEIHWVLRGAAQYRIGQQPLTLQAGQVLLIPARVFHCCVAEDGDFRRIAFQADMPWEKLTQRSLSPEVLDSLLPDWTPSHGGTPELTALLHLLCVLFCTDCNDYAQPIQDVSLIVEEFFSRRYHEPVTAVDLARALSLSEKQAHRLVRKLTGNTFRKELTARRLEVAEQLWATGQYTLTQIAEYVGYRSYSGFWKACRQNDLPVTFTQEV